MHQCAIIRESPPLTFDSTWSFEKVDEFLKELLPVPFEYADNHVSRSTAKTRSDKAKSVWVPLSKEKGKLKVVTTAAKATGKDLVQFKGRDKAPVKDCHIYVGEFIFSSNFDSG